MTPELRGIELSVQSDVISLKVTRFNPSLVAAHDRAMRALAILLSVEEASEKPAAAVLLEIQPDVSPKGTIEIPQTVGAPKVTEPIHATSREPPLLGKAIVELRALINENHGELPYGTILSVARKYNLKPNGINYRLKTLGITYKVMTQGGNARKPSKLPRCFSTAVEEALKIAGPQKKITPEAAANILAQFGIRSYRAEFMQRLSAFEVSCLPAPAPLPEPPPAQVLPIVKDPEPAANKKSCSKCDFYEPINNLKGLCNSGDEPRDVSADGYCKFFDFKGG